MTSAARYKIHPAIGVARVGNAPESDFFLGPEIPNEPSTGSGDAGTVARLLTQLYEVEAPGMIDGDRDDCAKIVERAVLETAPDSLRSTYLLVDDGEPVAMGAVATAGLPRRRLWRPRQTASPRKFPGRTRSQVR